MKLYYAGFENISTHIVDNENEFLTVRESRDIETEKAEMNSVVLDCNPRYQHEVMDTNTHTRIHICVLPDSSR